MKKLFLLFIFLSLSLFGQIVQNGLIAYYPFNGNTNDESGNQRHATNNGAVLSKDRHLNADGAYDFDGINQYLSVNSIPFGDQNTDKSISVWFKINSTNPSDYVTPLCQAYGEGLDRWAIDISSHGIDVGIQYDGASNFPESNRLATYITSNVFHHLVIVGSNSYPANNKLKIYLDGIYKGSISSLNIKGFPLPVTIQRGTYWSGTAYRKGELDEIRIYSRALSEIEITSLFQDGGWPSLNAGLVAYYPFNSNANDESSNKNNSTSNTAMLTTDRFGIPNSAYHFNGSSIITIPNHASLKYNIDTALTISAWCTLENFLDNSAIVSKGTSHYSYQLQQYAQKIAFSYVSHTVGGITNLALNEWIHFVAVVNKRNLKLYMNKNLECDITMEHPVSNDDESLRFGRSIGGQFWKGKIDDIRIYNRALNNNEIVSLYNDITISDLVWRAQLKANIRTSFDSENFAGVSDNATEGFDATYDIPEPPVSPQGDYISLYFPHPEWQIPTGNNFASDIKANSNVSDTLKKWNFEVLTNVINDTVKINFTNDRIPADLNIVLRDLTSNIQVDLKSNPLYKYINSSTASRKFQMLIGDKTPPQISLISPVGNNIWNSGTQKQILWQMYDKTGVDSVFIAISKDSGLTFNQTFTLGEVTSFNWSVPAEYLNHKYRVKVSARDSLGNVSLSDIGNVFTVVGDSLSATSQGGWNIIGFPLNSPDTLKNKIFGDDIALPYYYYLWSFNSLNGYGYVDSLTPLRFMKGYWLGLLSQSDWDIRGTAIEADSTVQLLHNGMNLVSDNFVRNVSKDRMFVLANDSYYSFNEAVSNNIIGGLISGYNGGYSGVETLSPFNGYWLEAKQENIQLIQKPDNIISPSVDNPGVMTPDNWELSLNLTSQNLVDKICRIGIKPSALNGYDQYDAPRPPRVPGNNYLEMYLLNPEFPSAFDSKWAWDFRSVSTLNTPVWTINVESAQSTQLVLSWDKYVLISLGDAVKANLIDTKTGQITNMKSDSSYVFDYTEPRQLLINATLVGDIGLSSLTEEFGLSQNYPNPFNPSTVIDYQLPFAGNVSLRVYDILGKQIKTLVDGYRDAGHHSVSFSGDGLANGVYIYRMQTGSFVQSRKLILMK